MTVDTQPVESRADRRYRASLPLNYFPFTSKSVSAVAAEATNCSRRGMCFQSDFPLLEGQYICVRRTPAGGGDVVSDREATVKSVSLAEVRWCRGTVVDGRVRYSVGVRYL